MGPMALAVTFPPRAMVSDRTPPAPPTTSPDPQNNSSNSSGPSCGSVLPPRHGSFSVEMGTGVSLGTVLAFWCRHGYQLVGSERVSCIMHGGAPQWTNYLPACEAIPRPQDHGLRVAVLASVVSGIIILAMSVSFIICCLQEHVGKRPRPPDRRSRRRGKRQASGGSECWLEREEGDWDAFPPPKIFHLPQRLDPHPHVCLGGLAYDNHGYIRSQDSLLNAPVPGLYRADGQLYPSMVLQRAPPTLPPGPSAPGAPVYLHLPPPRTDTAAGQPLPPPYHRPPYPNPTVTPSHRRQ